MVFECDKELSEVSENMRMKKLPRGNGVDATALTPAQEPISAISLSFDSSKIEKGVLSFEAFKQVYVSQAP